MALDPSFIRRAFARERLERGARHRDIAAELGVAEGELIAAHASAPGGAPRLLDDDPQQDNLLVAHRLHDDAPAIVQALEALGPVMALTRNDACVHEKVGVYRNVSHHDHVGLVLGEAIDLRVFYRQWAHGYAVEEARNGQVQRSLQFFDASGTAVHKVFLRPESDMAAYRALVLRHARAGHAAHPVFEPVPPVEPEPSDEGIDVQAFREAWRGLRDTHEFFGLLRRFGVSRTQALRLAEPGYAMPVDTGAACQLLCVAAQQGVSIMVFVGNPGMIQIHSGPVHRVVVRGLWLNVLDPGFNLHLREDHIAHAWVVRKPTVDGIVTSLEVFDAEGRTIAMFFGERKPGRPECCDWRNLVERLIGEHRMDEVTPCVA
jgi:putative hemin transport protein